MSLTRFAPESLCSLLEQTLEYGSCFDALYLGDIGVLDLLVKISTMPVSDRTIYAYRAACQFMSPSKHYIACEDSMCHFLVAAPYLEYIAIYSNLSGDFNILETPSEGRPLSQVLKMALTDLKNKPQVNERMSLLCSPLPVFFAHEGFSYIDDAVACRTIKRLDVVAMSEISSRAPSPARFIKHDYISMLSIYPPTYHQALLDRAELLATKAPLYWQQIQCAAYANIIRDNLLDGSIKVTYQQATRINSLFPNLIDPWYFQLSEETWGLLKLSPIQKAYALGYPIDNDMTDKELKQAMMSLASKGIDNYCAELSRHHLQQIKDSHKTLLYPDLHLVNEEDTLCERPEDYSPFDVLVLRRDNLLFRFTRPEFRSLIDSRVNPWNKEELSPLFLLQLANRLNLATIAGLPEPAPLRDILRAL